MNNQIALPAFAPLPSSMVLHMAAHRFPTKLAMTGEKLEKLVRAYLLEARQDYQSFYQRLCDILQELFQKISTARNYISQEMNAANAAKELNQTWLQASMSDILNAKVKDDTSTKKRHYSFTTQAIADFRQRNVLPNKPRSFFADRVAALLIVALVDSRQQGIAPSFIAAEEPYYWCYAQALPDAPIRAIACPWSPITTVNVNAPAGTLLWTPWPSLETGTLIRFGSLGSIGFSGQMSLQLLQNWNPELRDRERALIWGSVKKQHLPQYIERTVHEYAIKYLDPRRALDTAPVFAF